MNLQLPGHENNDPSPDLAWGRIELLVVVMALPLQERYEAPQPGEE